MKRFLVNVLFALMLVAGVTLGLFALAANTPQVEGGGYGAAAQPSFTLSPAVVFIDTRPNPPAAPVYGYNYWVGAVGHQPAVPGQCYYYDEITQDWRFPLNVISIQGTITFTAGAQTGRISTGQGPNCNNPALTLSIGAGVTSSFNLSIPPLYRPGTPYPIWNGGDSIDFMVTGGNRSDVIITISSYTTDGEPIWRTGQTPPTTQATPAGPTDTPTMPPTNTPTTVAPTDTPIPPTNTPVPPALAEGCQLFEGNRVIVCVSPAP